MKIRKSFITNSSSASFVVQKKFLSPNQINRIKNFIMSDEYHDMPWTIREYQDRIEGETQMDNGDLWDIIFNEIGIPYKENENWDEDLSVDPESRPTWIIEEE